MNRCAGCTNIATYQCVDNESLFLCYWCSGLLPEISVKKWSQEFQPSVQAEIRKEYGTNLECECCGSVMYHSRYVCSMCRGPVLTNLANMIGLENLDDHPLVFALVQDAIKFRLWLNLEKDTLTKTQYGFYPIGADYTVLEFSGIQNAPRK